MWQNVLDSVDDSAKQVDVDGVYKSCTLQEIAKAGGIYNSDKGLLDAVEKMTEASKYCLSTGFNMWCQSTLSWYTSRIDNEQFKQLHKDISSGEILGGTGLSNPFKTFSGLAEIKINGEKVDGGYKITGKLPWVSNVDYNHYLAIIFKNCSGTHTMALVKCDKDNTVITQPNNFIALEGTATVAVEFNDTFIDDNNVLTHEFEGFAPNIRSGFVILQCGMGLGILERVKQIIIDESKNPENAVLQIQEKDIQSWIDDITTRIKQNVDKSVNATTDDSEFWNDVLQLRRDLSNYTLNALQAGMLHSGAKGYLKNSLAERTLREGYFVATITPSLKQLELMLSK
ncbi:MAG: hypothetical protein ACPG8V_00830 [Alphaproteobacteria bacterium]